MSYTPAMFLTAPPVEQMTEAERRLASGPRIGRLKVRPYEDRFQVMHRARTMPWWRPGAILAGNDSRYWVFVLPATAAAHMRRLR